MPPEKKVDILETFYRQTSSSSVTCIITKDCSLSSFIRDLSLVFMQLLLGLASKQGSLGISPHKTLLKQESG